MFTVSVGDAGGDIYNSLSKLILNLLVLVSL
jgi:hypothetical protein